MNFIEKSKNPDTEELKVVKPNYVTFQTENNMEIN